MGIDFGTKRVGVSMSDPEGRIAGSPSVIGVRTERQVIADIKELAAKEGIAEIVVGLPLSLDGKAGPQADKAKSFASRLAAASGVKVAMWDERFSTVEAGRLLLGLSKRIRRQKEKRDSIAAVLILQSYLDSRPHASGYESSGT